MTANSDYERTRENRVASLRYALGQQLDAGVALNRVFWRKTVADRVAARALNPFKTILPAAAILAAGEFFSGLSQRLVRPLVELQQHIFTNKDLVLAYDTFKVETPALSLANMEIPSTILSIPYAVPVGSAAAVAFCAATALAAAGVSLISRKSISNANAALARASASVDQASNQKVSPSVWPESVVHQILLDTDKFFAAAFGKLYTRTTVLAVNPTDLTAPEGTCTRFEGHEINPKTNMNLDAENRMLADAVSARNAITRKFPWRIHDPKSKVDFPFMPSRAHQAIAGYRTLEDAWTPQSGFRQLGITQKTLRHTDTAEARRLETYFAKRAEHQRKKGRHDSRAPIV